MLVLFLSHTPPDTLPSGVVAASGRGLFGGLKLRRQRPEAAICASPAQQTNGSWPQIGICATPEDAYRYRPGTHLVAGTRACAGLLNRKGRAVTYLPLPIKANPTPLPVGHTHILVAAPLIRASCLDLLLKAVAAIPKVRLTLAGQGSQQSDLAELAERLALPVQFITHANAADYESANLVVHPVRADLEGSAIRAAHAAARPLIATATEAARELITANETGLVVPLADQAALTHSIRLLIGHPGMAPALAQSGFEIHQRDFNEDLLNVRWQRYLGQIIAPKPVQELSFHARRL